MGEDRSSGGVHGGMGTGRVGICRVGRGGDLEVPCGFGKAQVWLG